MTVGEKFWEWKKCNAFPTHEMQIKVIDDLVKEEKLRMALAFFKPFEHGEQWIREARERQSNELINS